MKSELKHSPVPAILANNWEVIYVMVKFFETVVLTVVLGYLITHW